MWLTVKLLLGRRCLLQVSENEKVFMLKRLVSKQLHVPEKQQRLLFRGQVLADNKRLSDYCIGPNSTLNVILRPLEKASPERSSQPQSPSQSLSLWPQVKQVLAKHFSPQDVEKVFSHLKEEHKKCLQQMSLDDLERLSKLLFSEGKHPGASGSSIQSKGNLEPRGDTKCNLAPKDGLKPEKSPGK
ncbi:ubiquitin-like protein 4B [Notamacropus eugenii]|uniref:ubiquitin-like protein 4B n=1 Tax=Notamacropus eugenii TaxID=9315 RepID=UPI003B66D121